MAAMASTVNERGQRRPASSRCLRAPAGVRDRDCLRGGGVGSGPSIRHSCESKISSMTDPWRPETLSAETGHYLWRRMVGSKDVQMEWRMEALTAARGEHPSVLVVAMAVFAVAHRRRYQSRPTRCPSRRSQHPTQNAVSA